ncbi:hypothetical protein [Laceyella tengchongensis]|jgi:hypothetical protein|uniref:hypothetical protein n=1 Tax=Laceyella tengchongensis TaxID=574699 RepID=UPI0012B6E608|nr:hypothetical protein [Laceyella tengchongensis]
MIRFWHDILGKKIVVIQAETQERKEIKVSSELMNTFLEVHEVTLDELNVVHYDSDRMMLFQSDKKREPEKTAP